MRNRTFHWLPLALMFAMPVLAGCVDDEQVIGPEMPQAGGELFARYVALGNSLTAGTQSGGINDSTQLEAYPVLLARQAGAPFNVPLLRFPGCPAPYAQPVLLGTDRIGGPNAPACALRSGAIPPPFISNVAYPGSFIGGAIDNTVVSNPASADVYKTLILGGRTQVEAMAAAEPTLVSVFLGNNETLIPAVAGDPNLFLAQPAFEAALDSIVRAIRNTPARDDAILIAPVNAVLFSPLLQPGAYVWALAQATTLPKPVSNNCAPGTPGSRNLVSLRVLSEAAVPTVSCADEAPFVLSPAEIATYSARVAAYGAAVRMRAEANDWIYIDPNLAFAPALADPSRFRKCQGLATAATPQAFQAAVVNTCPGPTAPNFFGSFISFDGVHPTGAGHRFLTNAVIDAINQEYTLNIPALQS